MQPWQVALLVLLGVLVGAIIPLLVQLTLTLRSWRSMARKLEPRLVAALDGLQRVAAAQPQEPSPLGAALSAAVGPAMVALVHAWRAQHAPEEPLRPPPMATPNGAPAQEVLQ